MSIQQVLTSGSNSYWQAATQAAASSGYSSSVVVAPSGYIYRFSDAYSYESCLTKYDRNGNIIFQKNISNLQPQFSSTSLCIDSSENLYVTGLSRSGSKNVCTIAKFDSNGSLQWSNAYGSSASANSIWGVSITINNTGDIYVLARSVASGTGLLSPHLIKLNSSGVYSSQIKLIWGSSDLAAVSISIDSNNEIYVTANGYISSPFRIEGYLIKLNSAFSIQWQKNITTGSVISFSIGSAAIDSNNNIYVCGSYDSNKCGLFKFNVSGSLLWQYLYSNVNGAFDNTSISLDPQANVYMLGDNQRVIKTNSDGAVLWCTRIFASGCAFYGLTVPPSGYFALTGSTPNSAPSILNFKLPAYQKLGTYSVAGKSFVYSSVSCSASTSFLPLGSNVVTTASASESYAAFALGVSTPSYTQYLTYI